MRSPDPGQLDRFRRDTEALTGAAPSTGRPLGLAVSGGPDSMALLLLGAAAYPGAVIAATVDHGLRPEAADEAAMVAGVCAGLGVPHATLAPEHMYPIGNLQERARIFRYSTLNDWARARGVPWVAVAHHRDDVAETFLMRARRGAGIGGMAAMARSRPLWGQAQDWPVLVRPLLDWPRCELACVVRDAGVPPVQDPSNQDPRFDRSRMRALIASTSELPAQRLALAARNLADAEDTLAWAAEREWRARSEFIDLDGVEPAGGGEVWLDAADLPYELRRRLVRNAVGAVRRSHNNLYDWHAQGLDRFVATLDGGGIGTIAGVIGDARQGKWHFRMAPARRSH